MTSAVASCPQLTSVRPHIQETHETEEASEEVVCNINIPAKPAEATLSNLKETINSQI